MAGRGSPEKKGRVCQRLPSMNERVSRMQAQFLDRPVTRRPNSAGEPRTRSWNRSAHPRDGQCNTREQLGLADVILLNKIDLISRPARQSVMADLAKRNHFAQVIPCKRGRVNLDQVLEIDRFSLDYAEKAQGRGGGGTRIL